MLPQLVTGAGEMSFRIYGALLCACVLSTQARAAVVAGAGGVSAKINESGFARSSGYKAFVSYWDDNTPLYADLSYFDQGEQTVTVTDDVGDTAKVHVGGKGINLSIGAYGVLFDHWLLLGKIGRYTLDAEAHSSGGSAGATDDGFSFGVGTGWMLNRYLGLQLDYENMGHADLSLTSLSAVFAFGGVHGHPHRISNSVSTGSSEAAPLPNTSLMTAEAKAAEQPPTRPAIGTTVMTRLESSVLNRPVQQGSTLLQIPAGASVKLEGTASNADGDWYFVSVGALRGWLPANAVNP